MKMRTYMPQRNRKNKKAAGINQIQAEALKSVIGLVEISKQLLNKIMTDSVIPAERKQGITKERTTCCYHKWRGMCLLSVQGKILVVLY